MEGRAGFSLVEVMVVAVLLGAGLGGLCGLLGATARLEGEARRHMEARVLALSALEQGAPPPAQGALQLTLGNGTARVAWREGNRTRELVLHRWTGHD